MKVGHCSDKADALWASRDLVVSRRAIGLKLSFRNQNIITRFDDPLRLADRQEVFVIEHFGCANRHHLDETKNQTPRRCEFYQRNQLILISIAHEDRVQLNLLEIRGDGGVNPTENLFMEIASGNLRIGRRI